MEINPVDNDLLGLAFENMSVGVYCRHIAKTGEKSYIFFNSWMKKMFGTDDVLSSIYWSQGNDDNYDIIVMSTLEPYCDEYPIYGRDGNVIDKWLFFSKRKVQINSSEEDYYIVTTVYDITARKRDELLLKESRQNLKIATDAGKMSIWKLDVATQIFTVTNGIDVKDSTISLNDHVLLRYYTEDVPDTHSELFDVMIGKKETGDSLYLIKDKNTGDILYRHSSYMGVRTNGVVKCVVGYSQDVTQVYRQRESLLRSHDELNLVLKTGDISAWIYNVEEKMFYALYGKPVAEKGLSLDQTLEKLHPNDRQKLILTIDKLLTKKDYYEVDVYRFVCTDGQYEYRYYDSRMMARSENGKINVIIGTQRDVTDEYMHNEQLEEFRMKYKLINSTTDSAIWDYDIEKRHLSIYYDDILSPKVSMAYEDYFNCIQLQDRDIFAGITTKAKNRTLENFTIEIGVKLPGDADYKKVEISGMPIKDEDGNVIRYSGIRHDLSKYLKLSSKVHEREVVLNTVINNLQAGLILFTPECKVIWSNNSMVDSFAKLLNRKRVLAGETCDFLVDGKCSQNNFRCMVRAAIDNRSIQIDERKYENDVYLDITSVPILNDTQDVSAVVLKIRDISENKRNVINLKKSKEKAVSAVKMVESLIDLMPTAILITNPEDDFKIVRVNNRFCELIHKSSDEILGKCNYDLLPEEEAQLFDSYDRLLVNGCGGRVSFESIMKTDGKELFLLVNKSIIEIDGKKLIVSVSADISDIKKLNKELVVAKEKALEADKLKSAFLANMSHEIRTPLNAIVGFSQLLTETDDINDRVEFSRIINNNTDTLLRLIGDILDLSKIESGMADFKRDMVDVSSFFNQLTESLAIKVTNPDVKFIVDNPYKTCYINLDKMRFGQVITNFVTNAIKYTEKGYIKVGYCIEKRGITIKVEDTGIGISPSKRDRVFTRFDKLDSMAQGTGLGLSISKYLTEMGGGKIWFESEVGKGTTFYSWKPFDDIRVIKSEETPKEEIEEHKVITLESIPNRLKRILVAEDNESNFALMKHVLKRYDVDRANNGAEAVEMVAKASYDLVFMDLKMPIMDGLDATRQIRKFNSTVPIFAVTANVYASDKEAALQAGCNGFVSKPIMKQDLINVLAKL